MLLFFVSHRHQDKNDISDISMDVTQEVSHSVVAV